MMRILLFTVFVSLTTLIKASDFGKEVRIYGKVTTVNNQEYEGYIQFGYNKFYWVDFFTATKISNPYTYYSDYYRGHLFNGGRASVPTVHMFNCRFGDLKRIRLVGNNKIEIQLRNSMTSEVIKSTNNSEIGLPIKVEIDGQTIETIQWNLLSTIEFYQAPEEAFEPMDYPILGVVITTNGAYKGFVQWDMDENSDQHILDGYSGSTKMAIKFENIKSIKKCVGHCCVELKSGRVLQLSGTNDINHENRGIVVNMPSIGRVIVPWKDFTFFETADSKQIKMKSYNDFTTPRRLEATVETFDDATYKGIIIYDLDEALDFEILDGKMGNIIYGIPIKNVKIIEPKNHEFSRVLLNNNLELTLSEYCDVNYNNDGLLIFRSNNEINYIPWKKIKRITFRNN